MTQDHKDFWKIIGGMRACMLVTTDDSVLRARPLAPFVDEESHSIQFVTDDDSAKVEELLKHQKLCLTFADTDKMQFASVSGHGQISEDRKLIDKLWGPYCEAFFPDGRDSVAVITVIASQAEYWDNDKGSLAIAYEVAKAYLGDEGPDLGQNVKLDL